MRHYKVLFGFIVVAAIFSGRADAAFELYGADGSQGNSSTLYTIDTSTGAVTAIGGIGFAITGLDFHPTTGVLYGVTSRQEPTGFQLVAIDPLTGAGTAVGAFNAGIESMADISFDSNGNLFGWGTVFDDLYTIDTGTGAATSVGNSGLSTFRTGLAFDNSDQLYLESGSGTLRQIDPSGGGVILTIGTAGQGAGMGMDFDSSNTLYAIQKVSSGSAGPRNLMTVDTSTGLATLIGPTQVGLDALAFGPAQVVPEPTSLVLFGMGGLTLFGYGWRRRRKTELSA